MRNLEKITPYNGFYSDPDLGQQNNYAWSMAELGDYIYVGTGRNIVYTVLSQVFGVQDIPEVFIPKPQVDPFAEIWRYNKKDPSQGWERVFKADPTNAIFGIRYMIRYKDALYADGSTFQQAKVLKSTDGLTWDLVSDGITAGDTARAMLVHNGTLYLGMMTGLGKGETETLLYQSTDPQAGWTKINTLGIPGQNPRGALASMASFNGHLYVGTTGYDPARPDNRGFEVWRTNGSEPMLNDWTLVVDRGAGEALNQLPLTMRVFNNELYVGTGIWFGIYNIYPDSDFVPPKGFDLIRINCNDYWEVIVGSQAIAPTDPTTSGRRSPYIPAGLGDISNAYCWQLEIYHNKLYLGTWDWSVLLPTFILNWLTDEGLANLIQQYKNTAPGIGERAQLGNDGYNYLPLIKAILASLPTFFTTMGGDLWVSETGCDWLAISLNGLDNPYNYGLRTLMTSSDGNMYIGTANPYQGCEVWRFNADENTDCDRDYNKGCYEDCYSNFDDYDYCNECCNSYCSYCNYWNYCYNYYYGNYADPWPWES